MSKDQLEIRPIRSLADNYIWVLYRSNDESAAVVDPGSSAPVLDFLEEKQLSLSSILITHTHWDHINGIEELLQRFPDAKVFGPEGSKTPGLTDPVREDDRLLLKELGVELQVIEIPGHTVEHVAYLGEGALFCGDTIFSCGCGRVFSGTFDQLADSITRLSSLPPETQMFCTHEYTVDNIGFAKWVDPENADLLDRDEETMALVERGEPTLPSTIGEELKCNPFMRLHDAVVVAAAEQHAGRKLGGYREVFRELRTWKDAEYD